MSPEGSPGQKRSKQEQLRAALENLRFEMSNYARGSLIDIAAYFPQHVAAAQELVRELAGQRVEGGLEVNQYFIPDPEGGEVYKRALLERHKYSTNDFHGVLQDLQDIEVETYGFTKAGKRLCLAVAPLDTIENPRAKAYYFERDREQELYHPFGVTEYAGQTIWIPIDALKERTLQVFDETKPLTG